jgi:3-oxoacyl-[acyl-carrier-protein] synthase II
VNCRVVVTGSGAITALGNTWGQVQPRLAAGRNAVLRMADYDQYRGLNCKLASPIDFEPPAHYGRKQLRSMGRVAKLAVRAAEMALQQGGLEKDPLLQSGRMGISFGSSSGSPPALGEFGRMLVDKSTEALNATSYVRMMPHTAAVNIGIFFEIRGRIITTCSACTAGSQGIGYAYEAIRSGRQIAMLAGGAEELDPTQLGVFDTLYATSTQNDTPELVPRPYDMARDGLVIGEGACALLLEEREHALARGVPILGEIAGFWTNSDGQHVTRPSADTMADCLRLAMDDAGVTPAMIGYVNGHGTATEHGDIAETQATRQALGRAAPISSLKSYIGHTLGACGAIEAWLSLEMMKHDWYAPTINLENVDPRCGDLDYIVGGGRAMQHEYVMSNNFAFGGINTSLILRRGD